MAAFATITVKKLEEFNKFLTPAAFTGITTAVATNGASSATYGAAFAAGDPDEKLLILIQNTNATQSAAAQKATIKAGNGLQGNKDLEVSLQNGEFTVVTVESGRFKNIAENDTLKALSSATSATQIAAKGKIFVTGDSAYIKIAVFKLP